MEDNTNKDNVLLTEQDVWDVIAFARAFSLGGMYGSQLLTPDLISGRMKDITLNPMAATEALLTTAMTDPKSHETQLQQFSQSFELTSMVYKRLLTYLASMLAFDITYTSDAKPEEYKTPKFRKDLDIVETFLDKFDYKRDLRIAVKEMLRNDAYFACFRDLGNGYSLQELPSDYCKITGRWAGGFLFSFNMYWFLQPGVDINNYPSFFKKKYNEIWGKTNTTQNYIPSLPPDERGKSTWIYWVDIPVDLGVCFKLTPELATRLPYFTPLFNDLVLQALMRNLQKNANMAAASKTIVGQVPMLDRDIKATVKDALAVSPEVLGKFMALVKNAISEAIKMGALPLEDIQGIAFDSENEIYESYLKTTLASSGINSNLIFSSNIKPNAIETQLSLNVDEQMMTSLYPQFSAFLNYQINLRTRNFKFDVTFEGTDFFLDRTKRLKDAFDAFDKGIVMPQKIAAAMGMKPSQMRKHMEEAKAMGFMDLLTPPSFEQQKELAKINQDAVMQQTEKQGEIAQKTMQTKLQQESDKEAGRPRKSESELSDEGLATRDQATNVGRGGKIR